MRLIDKTGNRQVCDECHRVRVTIRHGVVCQECRKSVLAKIIKDYRRQMSMAIPSHERSLMIPNSNMWDKQFVRRLQVAISELDASEKSRRRIAV